MTTRTLSHATLREVELLREMLERERSQYDRDRRGWEDERTFMRGMLERHTEQVKMLTDQREERDRRTEQSRSFLARWLRRP